MSRPYPEDILHRIDAALDPARDTGAEADRETLIAELMGRSRRLSTLSVLFAMSTADHLGMNLSDMLCLGILSSTGPMTLGQLASMIGLSTGSVTGLVDRLERLDLVCRERDIEDRRRIVLHLNTGRAEEIGQAFVPMLESSWQHLEQFTDDELNVIFRYIDGAIGFMQIATREMRARDKSPFADTLVERAGEA
jgi:DNA-binding MarR family transcriptional regulator